MSETDPYKILGLHYGATRSEIRSAWRAAARKFHPDSNPDNLQEAELKFQQAREAYDVLMSSVRDVAAPSNPARTHDSEDGAEQQQDSGVAHNPFEYWPGETADGADLDVAVHIDLATAISGGSVQCLLTYPVPHRDCGGQGCEQCQDGTETITAHMPVTVQPLTPDGAQMRMTRRGAPGVGGGRPGDLTITVRVDQDPVWVARDRDVYAHVGITAASGIAGTTLTLPHPVAPVEVVVPPSTYEPFNVTYPGAGIGGAAHVQVRPVPIDTTDPETAAALQALDEAQRSYLSEENTN